MPATPDDWFDSQSGEQGELLLRLREIVRSSGADFEESIKWGQPCYSLNSLVCYLNNFTSHVAFGFHQGAHLDDPLGLLVGQGKNMRHIKIHNVRDVRRAAFKTLIQAAIRFDANSPS